ncbi:MAG: aminotransferase class III-fold pyridoxal phosphate-dependent enzyme [Anaerolineales bacterium]|nr:aminotransferase class III-fold pyridoxal phosphate-dependent enzyme [Anaerolineales bacterium]
MGTSTTTVLSTIAWGFGPIILGHATRKSTVAWPQRSRTVCYFAATTPIEIDLAERFTRMTGMDKVRLSNTGTEANMHALRIACAYTGHVVYQVRGQLSRQF